MNLRVPLVYLAGGVGDLVLPSWCVGCDQAIEAPGLMCQACQESLAILPEPRCARCGKPVGKYSQSQRRCDDCKRHTPAFDGAAAPWVYVGLARDLVLKLKFCRAWMVAELAAPWMAGCLDQMPWKAEIDLIQPVPMHWLKRFWRGYNQAEMLALAVSRLAGIPSSSALRKARYTRPQSRLSRSSRLANLSATFRVRPAGSVRGKGVLLVDDVMTTGTTASECARVLKDAGARRVYVLTLARAH
ncbi:MAG: ComF family protein [Planctomycetes bacterium]|nr:ComF family protein [Planctomycetota bacterium]